MTFLKTSIVCLFLLIYMGVFYFSNKHLPVKSTRIFNRYYFAALGATVFDAITLYTVNCLDSIPESVNLIVHILYMLFINVMIYYNFQYTLSLLDQQVQISKSLKILQGIPLLVTSVLIVFLPIEYIQGRYTNYSMGAKVYALYTSVIFYNLIMLYYGIRYIKYLNKEKRVALLASVPIFFVVSIIAISIPESLFVLVYIILTAVGLMMSGENSEKYLDSQTGMFNQYAFGIVCNEQIHTHADSYVTLISLSETVHAHATVDWRYYITVLEELQHFCKKEIHTQVYKIGDNGFAFLSSSKVQSMKLATKAIQHVIKYSENKLTAEYNTIPLSDCSSSDELMSQCTEICMNALNKSASFDFLTGVHNRNSFEKYIAQYRKNSTDAYYFIIDVNYLKQTNDVIGHSAGDELLQSVASLLSGAVSSDGIVFRQGGDEFAILWNGTNPYDLLTKLESRRRHVNRNRYVPISFAIGYAKLLEENGMEKADAMMYQNKAKMKAGR